MSCVDLDFAKSKFDMFRQSKTRSSTQSVVDKVAPQFSKTLQEMWLAEKGYLSNEDVANAIAKHCSTQDIIKNWTNGADMREMTRKNPDFEWKWNQNRWPAIRPLIAQLKGGRWWSVETGSNDDVFDIIESILDIYTVDEILNGMGCTSFEGLLNNAPEARMFHVFFMSFNSPNFSHS